MKKFFVTGTDTDVGKSLVSAILLLACNAHYWKPIQAGSSDTAWIQQLTQLPDHCFMPSVYSLKAPLSPDQAASLENINIELDKIKLPETENLIVEGAGGVCVPINTHHSMLDIMKQLALPVIIVARGTLGTINHTLLTIKELEQQRINIKGVVFSGELNPDNQRAIEHWSGIPTLFHVPFFNRIEAGMLVNWIKENSILEKLV